MYTKVYINTIFFVGNKNSPIFALSINDLNIK